MMNWTTSEPLHSRSPVDLDTSLNSADFDGSLSGLELGTGLYGALTKADLTPSALKQENHSRHSMTDGYTSPHSHSGHMLSNQQLQNNNNNMGNSRCCSQQQSALLMNLTSQQGQGQMQQQQQIDAPNLSQSEWVNLMTSMNLGQLYDSQFQYVLGASTTPATKLNEETLTYLNQGQSYELKLKKLGELMSPDGQQHLLKSMVRVVFHERRLQYNEREKLNSWRQTRPGERILDIDIPLSYGLLDVKIDPQQLSCLEFVWDPRRDCAVFIKINCISTEFTAKRHGGEKGVPFRIQVETYSLTGNGESKIVHCASCQVKVFKPKGADRKHKTDKEKLDKKSDSEREKYQPSYEYTFLNEIPLDQVKNYLDQISDKPNQTITAVLSGDGSGMVSPLGAAMMSPSCLLKQSPTSAGRMLVHTPNQAFEDSVTSNGNYNSDTMSWSVSPVTRQWSATGDQIQTDDGYSRSREGLTPGALTSPTPSQEIKRIFYSHNQLSSLNNPRMSADATRSPIIPVRKIGSASDLHVNSDMEEDLSLDVMSQADEVVRWLHLQRFSKHIETFRNFSGSDLMRLTRDDFIQICGLADGIRLNNALHSKKVRPKLTLYLFQDPVANARDRLKKSITGTRWGSNYELSSSSSTPPSTAVITSTSPSLSPFPSNLSPKPLISSTLDSPLQIRKKLVENIGEPMSPKRRSSGFDSPVEDVFNSSPKRLRTRNLALASDETCFAVYLERCTVSNLVERLADLYGVSVKNIGDVVCRRVESGTPVNLIVTDNVLENMVDQSKFGIDAVPDDDNPSVYHIHLRAAPGETE